MREVVEHESGDGDGAEVFEAGGAGEVLERGPIGEEGEGGDGLVVATLVGHAGVREGGAVFVQGDDGRGDLLGFGDVARDVGVGFAFVSESVEGLVL